MCSNTNQLHFETLEQQLMQLENRQLVTIKSLIILKL